jgi:Na+-driven multidrug efflux pump
LLDTAAFKPNLQPHAMLLNEPLLKTPLLTQGPIAQQLMGLTLPLAWGLFTVLSCNLIDALLVSHLGNQALAAYALTFPVSLVASNIGAAAGLAVTTLVARQLGHQRLEAAQHIATASMIWLSVLGGALTVSVFLGRFWLYNWLGASPGLTLQLEGFFPHLLPSFFFLVLSISASAVLRATGDTVLPSSLMGASALLQIALDWLLILPHPQWGLPGYGLMGLVWANTLSKGSIAFVTLFILVRKKLLLFHQKELLEVSCEFRLTLLRVLLSLAFPALMGQLLLPFSLSLVTRLVAHHGNAAIAAYGLVYRIESFALIGMLALSTALIPFVGQNSSASRQARALQALKVSFGLCIIYGGALAFISFLTSHFVLPYAMQTFQAQAPWLPLLSQYFRALPFSYWGIGLTLCLMNTLNAMGHPIQGFIVVAIRLLVLVIPFTLVGNAVADLNGVFSGLFFANTLAGVVALIWFYRWQKGLSKPPALNIQALIS